MNNPGFVSLMVFLAVSCTVLLAYVLIGNRRTRVNARLEELENWLPDGPRPQLTSVEPHSTLASITKATLPKVGTALMPESPEEQTQLQTRLIQAGLYSRQAMPMYLGVKLLLIVGPALAGAVVGGLGLYPLQHAVLVGCALGLLGLIGPGFWLDYRKNKRQEQLRRAIPDAMDGMVICLEGGLSIQAALQRVSSELKTAHPLLAREMNIIEREIQLGQTAGDAFVSMGARTDLEEIRTLASVINQSDRFGASLVRALRVHAETLRLKRHQHAQARAQRAAVKVLFPTILCIFPAMFVVILGPAVFRFMTAFPK